MIHLQSSPSCRVTEAKRIWSIVMLVTFLPITAWSANHEEPKKWGREQQAKNEQRGTEQAPIFVYGEVTTKKGKEEARAEAEEHKLKSEVDSMLVEYTGLLSLFTFLLFIFTAGLWWVTLQLSRHAKKDSERQAAETQQALAIAKESADTAQRQVNIAADELKRSHRAWVSLSGGVEIHRKLVFEDGVVKIAVRATVANSGNSTATKVILVNRLIVEPFPGCDPRTFAATAAKGLEDFGLVILPGASIPMDTTIETTYSAAEAVCIWWSGVIGYSDELGESHATNFLFRFTPDKGENGITPRGTVNGRFAPFGVGWKAT